MLDDLTPHELAMLGHALRMVPENACLTHESAELQGKRGLAFFYEIEAYTSLCRKVVQAVATRDDMEPFRVREVTA